MGSTGRKPKMADLSVVGGSSYVKNGDRKEIEERQKKAKAAKAVKFPFKCPPKMSTEFKAAWRHFEKALAKTGRYGPDDLDDIVALCVTKVEVEELRASIAKDGRTYWSETREGATVIKANPAVNMLDKAQRRFSNLLYEHGLTPLGRVKLGISLDGSDPAMDEENEDPAEAFFK